MASAPDPLRGEGPLLLLLLGAALSASLPPKGALATARLGCWFVEEAAGGGSVMPSALSQRRALLLLVPPGGRMEEAALEAELLPPEVEPGLAFQILDPSGTLWGGRDPAGPPLWWQGAEGASGDPPGSSCEINAYTPQEAHVAWAAGLVGERGCPRALERGKWLIASVQAPRGDFGVSSVLHAEEEQPSPGRWEAAGGGVTTAAAVLSVFTRTPRVGSRLGQAALLDCGFSAPAGTAFSVEWRHQYRGAGRVVLAYEGAARRVWVAEEGAGLFVDTEGGGGNVSLRLESVAVRHEGTYICTVYLPHLHAQQALELKVVEPPKVTLRPNPLSVPPSAHAELACEISGFYPLGVSVNWKRQSTGSPQDAIVETTWDSGHRQSPDGTFSFTSFTRLVAVQPEDHGASYSCHVAHVGLGDATLKKTVRLRVAGSLGPSAEDAICMFLIAIALFGILQALFGRALEEKPKSEKLE
ncbi:tapasin [Rhineura floridana]|uniref:tapasin n=1 Tax=Rhineura floridana TaxID=261503 RepID=UPI002AC840DB|nr:tapasin [Rhineura floridana]